MALESLADEVAAQKRFAGYSQIQEWRDHAMDRLIVASGKYDPTRCKDPRAFLTRAAVNAIIDRLRVATGCRSKTPQVKLEQQDGRLDTYRVAAPTTEPDYSRYEALTALKAMTLGQDIPEGKSGLYRCPKGQAWVITRLEDHDV